MHSREFARGAAVRFLLLAIPLELARRSWPTRTNRCKTSDSARVWWDFGTIRVYHWHGARLVHGWQDVFYLNSIHSVPLEIVQLYRYVIEWSSKLWRCRDDDLLVCLSDWRKKRFLPKFPSKKANRQAVLRTCRGARHHPNRKIDLDGLSIVCHHDRRCCSCK